MQVITTNAARSILNEELGIMYFISLAGVKQFFDCTEMIGDTKHWEYKPGFIALIDIEKARLNSSQNEPTEPSKKGHYLHLD